MVGALEDPPLDQLRSGRGHLSAELWWTTASCFAQMTAMGTSVSATWAATGYSSRSRARTGSHG